MKKQEDKNHHDHHHMNIQGFEFEFLSVQWSKTTKIAGGPVECYSLPLLPF